MYMTKSDGQRVLASVKEIYVVGYKKGTHLDRYQWRKFHLYYVHNSIVKGKVVSKLLKIEIDPETVAPCWKPRHKTRVGNWTGGYWQISERGIDRPERIVRLLGQWLFDVPGQFKSIFLSD